MSEVQFRIGRLKIGEIHGLPADNKGFVPDLISVIEMKVFQKKMYRPLA